MTNEAKRIRDEAMRQAPQPDLRIRTSADGSRELTDEENQKYGFARQAGPAKPAED